MNPSTDEGAVLAASWATLPVFRFQNQIFSLRDVLDSAHVRGDLLRHWDTMLRAEASARHAEENELPADPEAIESLCNEFRYARDIVTTEETENWLSRHRITENQLLQHFEQAHWLGVCGLQATLPDQLLRHASPERWDTFRVYLTLANQLETLARRLAQRLVVGCSCSPGKDELPQAVDLERRQFLGREPLQEGEVEEWLRAKERTSEWLNQQFEAEAIFKIGCNEALSPARKQRALGDLGMTLLSFDFEVMEVDTPEILKEARLSIDMDDIPMKELAEEHGFPYRRQRAFLEALPESLQQPFLSAGTGDLVPSSDGRHRLYRVIEKREPQLDDPEVDRHLHRRLLGGYLMELESKHVDWMLEGTMSA